MPIILGSRRDIDGNTLSFFDTLTNETVARFQAAVLDEDFVGAGHSLFPTNGTPAAGYPWVQRIQKSAGNPTVAVISNSPGGIIALAIDSTNEKQGASLYSNDQLNWDVTKALAFETRAAFSVLPGAGVEIVMGLQSAWVDGPDTSAVYLRFQANSSGAVNAQVFDGILAAVSISTGFVLVPGVFYIFRIDASDLTRMVFSINGVNVASAAFTATGAASVLQPFSEVYKSSGVGVGTLQIDAVQIGMNRS